MRAAKFPAIAVAVLAIGCVAPAPTDAHSALDRFRQFLLETDTAFTKRAGLPGLKIDLDPTTLQVGDAIRLETPTGNFVRYARLHMNSAQAPLYLASMTTIFDTQIICIRRADVAALGVVLRGSPIVVHQVIGGELRVTGVSSEPDRVELSGARGPINVSLVTFERGCLAEVEHTVQIVKE